MTVIEARHQFEKLIDTMSEKHLRRAVIGTLKKESRRVANAAKRNLRASGMSHASEISSGLRSGVMKGLRGYYVSVTPEKWGRRKYRAAARALAKGKEFRRKGIHTNRANKEKPVLMWAESGTKRRQSCGKGVFEADRGHMFGRRGMSPGEGLGFLHKAENNELQESMDRIGQIFNSQVAKIASKYGML